MNRITLLNNGYRVEIDTDNFILGDGSLERAIKEILTVRINWWNFKKKDVLWYSDGMEYLTCVEVDNVDRVIVFI